MILTLERPKDIDLESLFEVRVEIAPTYNDVLALPWKSILVGTPKVTWVAAVSVTVTGLLARWPKGKIEKFAMTPDIVRMGANDTLHVRLNWDIR